MRITPERRCARFALVKVGGWWFSTTSGPMDRRRMLAFERRVRRMFSMASQSIGSRHMYLHLTPQGRIVVRTSPLRASNSMERTVSQWDRTVLAMDCALAGAQMRHWPAAQFGHWNAFWQ